MTAGWSNTSTGSPRPAADPAPWPRDGRTPARRGMSCSMTSMAAPVWSRMRRNNGPSASVSRWATPADGSSSKMTAGSSASRQASSTMRRVPVDSAAMGVDRVPVEPEEVDQFGDPDPCRPRRGARRAGGDGVAAGAGLDERSQATAIVSSTVSEGNSRASWKVRPMPSAGPFGGCRVGDVDPAEGDRPSSTVWKPEMQSISVVLPAPFCPISPTISPGVTTRSTSESAGTPPNRSP